MTKQTKLVPHAEVVARNRYYLKNTQGETTENSYDLFNRVAKAVAKIDDQYYTLYLFNDPFASTITYLENKGL